jgi:1,4-dihydroxy-2-naphthoate polyprenyltransferase
VAAFVVWGPLMIGGGYYVITGKLSGEAFLVSVPIGLGVASILIGKHIDQRVFDTSQQQRTLPVLLGERGARLLNQVAVAAMYVVTVVAIGAGSMTVFALIVFVAAPRGVRALQVMSKPAPAEAPAGYVGWPLWYHRVCLVHHRAFGWLFILGLAAGAIFPDVRIG